MYFRKVVQGIVIHWRALRTEGCGLPYIWAAWKSLFFNRREMDFLGQKIKYDAYLTPFFLYSFVPEISRFIVAYNTSAKPVVLDIGANYGGWGYTLMRLVPGARLYSFEPNPVIFDILKQNSEKNKNWTAYNLGLFSDNQERAFFFVHGKSAQGSIHKKNSNLDLLAIRQPEKINVSLRCFASTPLYRDGISHFDFVKVDVEGAEFEVLQGLAGITWSYLYVEATCGAERHGSNVKDILTLIKDQWGHVDILYERKTSDFTVDLIVGKSMQTRELNSAS